MHKIILSRSIEEKFCTAVFTGSEERNFDGLMTRRLSIQNSGGGLLNLSCRNFPKARTIFTFGAPYSSIADIPSSLKLLRVLHLEGASLETFPKEIAELLLLKYLCLRNTNIKSIHKSLGNLRHLETLDLKQTGVTELPKEILNLDNLRHLLVYSYDNIQNYTLFDSVKGFEVSAKVMTPYFQKLQKLSFIKVNRHNKMIQWLGNLTQLRKLGIIDLPREEGSNLCHSIQMLQNLRSLNVTSLKEEPLDLQAISYPPPLLQRLYLKGQLDKLPIWTSSLHDLVRIHLKWSRLTASNNPIELLQDLPNLLELQLLDAYIGNQLDFNPGKFQKLKILELEQLEQLRVVIMEKSTLPHLEKLIIRRCNNLKQVPVGIDNLTCLKELHLYDMPNRFVAQLKSGGELRHLVRHIPHIHCYYLQRRWMPEDL
uniref:Putative disease resistance protein RPM1-like n=1 Tax=Davidia involucrata TaxID=16924 RepID=A0A5B7ADF2_DAVIN